jgi:hypothetical protein
MYLKMAEDEDKKMADRWQKDADGILIFVSAYNTYSPLPERSDQHEHFRLVYSRLPSRHWSRSLFRI